MKHGIMIGIMLSFFLSIRGQTMTNQTTLSIESGLAVNWEGDFVNEGGGDVVLNGSLVLEGDLTNNSNNTLTTGTGYVILKGTSQQVIGGSKEIRLYGLTHDNTGGTLLNQDLEVEGRITMIKGKLDLNGKIIDLGSTGEIDGESNASRIMGSSGKVVLVRTLNNIDEQDLAGIGLGIDVNANMGSTLIERSHQVRTLGSGTSIKRSINIQPTNNNGLNAAIRLFYFSDELNGQNPNSLDLFRKPNGAAWTVNTNSVTGNGYVDGNGYNSLGLFTLSSNGTTALENLRPALAVRYFPNPLAQGQFLRIDGLLAGDYQLFLYDLTGKQVWKQERKIHTAGGTEKIDLPLLPNGLYTFRILSDKYAPTTGKLQIHSH